jgi:hypothetical protein
MKRQADIDRLFTFVQRDHGDCDQSTCTLGVAIRHGYALVAIDHWIGSGAACEDFMSEAAKGLPFSLREIKRETAEMIRNLSKIECPECRSIVWDPEWASLCDDCGHALPKEVVLA